MENAFALSDTHRQFRDSLRKIAGSRVVTPSTPGAIQGDVGTGGRSGLDARGGAALRDRHRWGRSGRALDHCGEQWS